MVCDQLSGSEICRMIADCAPEKHAGVSLVASENRMSSAALYASASDLTHRYTIPPEGERPSTIWDYPNQGLPRGIAKRTEELARSLYHAAFADVRPLSGNNAVLTVLKALTSPGDTVMSVSPDCGGHFATKPIADLLNINLVYMPYDQTAGNVDVGATAALCKALKPALVLFDASMVLFAPPLQALRDQIGPDPVISYDASHTLGLIAGGQFCSPLDEGADLLHGSTHKTLFGPQKGMILCRENSDVAAKILDTTVPLFASNIHSHHVAALGVALEELREFGRLYAAQVVENARALAASLCANGVDVFKKEPPYTDSHQVWAVLGERDSAMAAFQDLEDIGVFVNAIGVPFTGKYGLRIGVAEATRLGMKADQAELLGHMMAACLNRSQPAAALRDSVASIGDTLREVHYGFRHALPA